jgi:hypothetical protein
MSSDLRSGQMMNVHAWRNSVAIYFVQVLAAALQSPPISIALDCVAVAQRKQNKNPLEYHIYSLWHK